MLREAVFAGIEQYADDFRFGIQTNATLARWTTTVGPTAWRSAA